MAGLTIQQQLEEAQRFGLSLDEARTARSCGLTYEQYAAGKASGKRLPPVTEGNTGLSEREMRVVRGTGITPEAYVAGRRQPEAPEVTEAHRQHVLAQMAHYAASDPVGLAIKAALGKMASETGGNE